MKDLLKIKLEIADRIYPLTITPVQEEELRKSAKNINNLIKEYEQNYAVNDKQDVLAMCTLQFATQIEQLKNDDALSNINQRLSSLNQLIDLSLEKK